MKDTISGSQVPGCQKYIQVCEYEKGYQPMRGCRLHMMLFSGMKRGISVHGSTTGTAIVSICRHKMIARNPGRGSESDCRISCDLKLQTQLPQLVSAASEYKTLIAPHSSAKGRSFARRLSGAVYLLSSRVKQGRCTLYVNT